ncbi:MAG: hypothetical protein ABIJ09_04650 [Pseudomonadota bacterium]
MQPLDFVPYKVHIITNDAYLTGSLLLPQRTGAPGAKLPRFLDVLNAPATFLKNPGEVGSTTTVILVAGVRHSFHGEPPRAFQRMFLRLDSVLLGSDESPPGPVGTGIDAMQTGPPSELDIILKGGLHIVGMVRGGAKAAMYPRADHPFLAATRVRYTTPLTPGETLELPFAAINNKAIESVVVLGDEAPVS